MGNAESAERFPQLPQLFGRRGENDGFSGLPEGIELVGSSRIDDPIVGRPEVPVILAAVWFKLQPPLPSQLLRTPPG